MIRPAREVLEDHLRLRRAGRLEEDLARNAATDVVVLTASGAHRGHDAVRAQADALRCYSSPHEFEYRDLVVEGDVGYLEWTARGNDTSIRDAADTYIVRDSRIALQTIHYTVVEADTRRDITPRPHGSKGRSLYHT